MKPRKQRKAGKAPGQVREPAAVYTVREAKARLSEVVRLASQGSEVIITSHNVPVVKVSPASPAALRVPWKWLHSMKVSGKGSPAESIVREDRDGRG